MVAVDRLTERIAPHFFGKIEYLRADILANKFPAELSQCFPCSLPGTAAAAELGTPAATQSADRNVSGEVQSSAVVPVIVCGMHLCGVLSPRAVDLVVGQPAVVGIVLSPCCFPSKKLLDIRIEAGTNEPTAQYAHWCKILADYIAPQMSGE